MTHKQCGPGLMSSKQVGLPRRAPVPDYESPWWYDGDAHEIVRASDGRRWRPDDVPELRRSLDDRDNPVVDVEEVDRWVLAQRE